MLSQHLPQHLDLLQALAYPKRLIEKEVGEEEGYVKASHEYQHVFRLWGAEVGGIQLW